jgi:hypothetical protein
VGSEQKNDYLNSNSGATVATVQPESAIGSMTMTASPALAGAIAKKSTEPYLLYFGKNGQPDTRRLQDSQLIDMRAVIIEKLGPCLLRAGVRMVVSPADEKPLAADPAGKDAASTDLKALRAKYEVESEAVVFVSASGEKLKVFSGDDLNVDTIHTFIHRAWPDMLLKLREAAAAAKAKAQSEAAASTEATR